ncbi:MAG: hypothetical protein LBU94_00220 [Clostridiales bacterium]|nr:hypothetical protein [Clostridiales bacterium]
MALWQNQNNMYPSGGNLLSRLFGFGNNTNYYGSNQYPMNGANMNGFNRGSFNNFAPMNPGRGMNYNMNPNIRQAGGYGQDQPNNMPPNQHPMNRYQMPQPPMNQYQMPQPQMSQPMMNQYQMPQPQMPQSLMNQHQMPQPQMPQLQTNQFPMPQPQQTNPRPRLPALIQPQEGQSMLPENQQGLPISQGPVSYQPLDEKTMEEVQRLIAEKRKHDGETGQQVSTENTVEVAGPGEGKEDERIFLLRELIQGERNASIFYNHMAKEPKAPKELGEISRACEKRRENLNGLYKELTGVSCSVKETPVIGDIGYKDGLKLAISTENDAVENLRELYKHLNDNRHHSKLNELIHGKLYDILKLNNLPR